MNDDELTRLFRSLDEPAEPRAAFADTLFADLVRVTSGAMPGRRTSVRWLLVAATLLLVASLGAAAIGSGLIKLPFVVDLVSPTPSASGTTLASGTPAPSSSTTASASPDASAIVINGLAKSTVDGLRVRATPGTAGALLGTIDTGQMGFVVAGPVSADGFAWYQLAALGLPPNAGCEPPVQTNPFSCPDWLGWVAAGQPGSQPWLAPTELPCVASPMNVDALVNAPSPVGQRTPLERLACYGSTSIRVRGWWPQIPDGAGLGGACGRVVPPNPAWLVCQNINYNGLSISESAGFEGVGVKISIDPATGVTMPPRGQWVEVVGHLDDPAARDCAPVASGDQDPVRVVLTCRSELVAESVTSVAGPY
ncbi:MAG: hypothetical protein M3R32_06800 [Chloroflexota bacterium]|nr:hypothetical protein [Chloroflexota bacterium]